MAGILDARPRVGYFYSGKNPGTLLAERIRKILVREVMSVPIVVGENVSVYDAAVTMFLEDVGSLFIVKEGGFLEGVVSRKDLLKAALGRTDLQKIPVGVVMTRRPNIITVTPDDPVYLAAQKLVYQEVDALPVVEEPADGPPGKLRVVGRITKTNITRLFVELGKGE
ncbi:MAG: DeoR family transcriptional regulator, catabolite repression regulator [Eubacteriales bacterium]|nr:DeoR family transcriptional regulator, catabolite repression regulator [Eubacteriales bacterium]MDN5363906.1 DeoR family transcriptional regulator, catabolite repression regulator [Eubacteriales bacterium]